MYYDLTLKITPELMKDANQNEIITLFKHIGTHFDVMDQKFPLDYLHLSAVIFNVSLIQNHDIEINDIKLDFIQEIMFIAFYTRFNKEAGYDTARYFKEHPPLSKKLVEALIQKRLVSLR